MPALRHLRRISLPGHAQSRAEVIAVRPALKYPNVTLLTNACVQKLGNQREWK